MIQRVIGHIGQWYIRWQSITVISINWSAVVFYFIMAVLVANGFLPKVVWWVLLASLIKDILPFKTELTRNDK